MKNIDNCLRCGKCCYGEVDEVLKPCPYLKILKNGNENGKGKTKCIIYKKRLGTIIYKDNNSNTKICGFRKDSDKFIEGCPINPK